MKRPTQTERLYELLKEGRPVRTDEIAEKIYSGGSLARVGARINDLAVGNWPGKTWCQFVDERGNLLGTKRGEHKGWHDPHNAKLYWYRMKIVAAPKLPPARELARSSPLRLF
jgi:hypothetical protein